MTKKLVKEVGKIKRKKREDYIMYNPYSSFAFYEEKTGNSEKKANFYEELRFPCLVAFLLFTGYTGVWAVCEANEGRELVEKSKSVEKGSGYTFKLLPLNIA